MVLNSAAPGSNVSPAGTLVHGKMSQSAGLNGSRGGVDLLYLQAEQKNAGTGRAIAELFHGGVIMAVNREELVECLNDLIQTCRDGENGFQTAADHVKDSGLKTFFNQCSVQRAQFASELGAEVRQLGGTPSKTGSVSAAFHRGWMNIKAMTGGSDDAIVAECER